MIFKFLVSPPVIYLVTRNEQYCNTIYKQNEKQNEERSRLFEEMKDLTHKIHSLKKKIDEIPAQVSDPIIPVKTETPLPSKSETPRTENNQDNFMLKNKMKELENRLDAMDQTRDMSLNQSANVDLSGVFKEIENMRDSSERQIDLLTRRVDSIEPLVSGLEEMHTILQKEVTERAEKTEEFENEQAEANNKVKLDIESLILKLNEIKDSANKVEMKLAGESQKVSELDQ